MTNETMRTIELTIKDMLTGLKDLEENKIYAYHHKIECMYNLIIKTAKDIEDYRSK